MTNDKIDNLLSEWHDENRAAAEEGRAAIMRRIRESATTARPRPSAQRGTRYLFATHGTGLLAAALFVVVALIAVLALPARSNRASAQVIQVPDGGRLEAFDPEGHLVGPCPLKHTAVNAEISGPFVRVELAQRFENTYDTKIEAVYTFPMSHRGAVDFMKMTITDPDGGVRFVLGEVKERSLARYIYEQAKASGYVASLLEQERPNIFTQSVANIEPGASVLIEIAYIEVLEATDGEYAFEFPTVVGPRYIPGSMTSPIRDLPEGVVQRPGLVLRGPATITLIENEGTEGWTADAVNAALASAFASNDPAWAGKLGMPPIHAAFTATYSDGSSETGYLYSDGYGSINGRSFFWQLPEGNNGGGFSPNTDQVPDASKITPMPVKPPTRAGHDISISVTLDTGGVAVKAFGSPLHEIEKSEDDGVMKVSLKNQKSIPNRDFVLRWRLEDDKIEESIFTHVTSADPANPLAITAEGGFLSMVLAPPARVEDESVRARELIFVLDTSGSMRGFPIEKSKAVAQQAIAKMRAGDTFNVITFAGKTAILWPEPKPATEDNQAEAMRFIDTLQGGGGTEMMSAINAALVQTAAESSIFSGEQLADLPADGRKVSVLASSAAIVSENGAQWLVVRDDLRLPLTMSVVLPQVAGDPRDFVLDGTWMTEGGRRLFSVTTARFVEEPAFAPMRIAMFFTDGYVGNDQGIIQAVRDNARSTRVFSFGIGDGINRFLLDGMSDAGRGEVEYVLLNDDADAAAARLARRIQTPVLTDIEVTITGVDVADILPKNPDGLLPDLYDEKPIVLHARFVPPAEGSVSGTVTITGRTGNGRYERVIPVEFPAVESENDAIATLWARAKVDDLLAPHLGAVENQTLAPEIKGQVVRLGEAFSIMTPYTSFVAVEKSRVTISGQPMLVNVPIELPSGTSWEGFFGGDCSPAVLEAQQELLVRAGRPDLPPVEASPAEHTGEAGEFELEADEIRLGAVLKEKRRSASAPKGAQATVESNLHFYGMSNDRRSIGAPGAPGAPQSRTRSDVRRLSPQSSRSGFGGGAGGKAAATTQGVQVDKLVEGNSSDGFLAGEAERDALVVKTAAEDAAQPAAEPGTETEAEGRRSKG